ncbi:MAG: phospholipase D family protein [Anaeromyxobacter sp.]
MLEPRARTVYLDALKPPPGYRLDRAIGTTYSVDLHSLLAIPLAFAQLDWAERAEELVEDRVRLLRALRTEAARVTLFCQAGRIAVPRSGHPLFAYLEPMLRECAVRGRRGEFHPKTWVLRFTDGEGQAVRYRFLCLSRNLTSDTSWDTALALEGELVGRANAFGRNHPLGAFIEALPGLALGDVSLALRQELLRIAYELRRVRFEPPAPFRDGIVFAPLGIDGHRSLDLGAEDAQRLLVVSPFATSSFLERAARARENVLVSRQETLDELPPQTLGRFQRVYVIDEEPFRAPDQGQADGRAARAEERSGLHAKLFVVDGSGGASVWTGSANASDAAFERNVEFMVGLSGRKGEVGTQALVGEGEETLRTVLLEYARPDAPRAPDPQATRNEELVEEVRRTLAQAGLRLAVEVDGSGLHALRLDAPGELALPDEVQVRVWPATLQEGRAERLLRGNGVPAALVFRPLSPAQLTAFACFEVCAGAGEQARAARFTLLLPLAGGPADRLQDLLATVLEDGAHLVRLLMLLLTDQELDPAGAADALRLGSLRDLVDGSEATSGAFPLLEELLRTAARNPARLGAVHSLVQDLRRTERGRALLPPEFDGVWDAIWAARGGT